MRIYRIFADNLRAECQRVGSVAEVCRLSGINRQQMNKYLAGQMMPTARTLQRLSDSLGIAEESLFAVCGDTLHQSELGSRNQRLGSAQASQVMPPIADTQSSASEFRRSTHATHRSSATPNAIAESAPEGTGNWESLYTFLRTEHPSRIEGFETGFYACYFYLQNYTNFLVRSVMKVTLKRGITFFTRHTHFDSPSLRKVRLAQGRNVGFVIGSQTEIYLLAKNRLFPPNISLITLQKDRPSGTNVYVGLCLTKGINQAFATRACVEYVGKSISGIAGIAGRNSIVPISDPSVNPHVAFYMAEAGDDKTGQISATPTEKLIMAAAEQTSLGVSQRPSRRAR